MPRYASSATGGPMGVRRSGLIPLGSTFSPLDLSPALWVDTSDASSVTISGSSGAYIGPNGLVCSGVASNYASLSDLAARRPTGDLDVIVKVTATDWTPVTAGILVLSGSAAAASSRNYYLYLDTNGKLVFARYGSADRVFTSTVATGVTDGATKWVRVTFDQDNGSAQSEVRFYLGDDGTNWTQLGATVTNGDTGAGLSNTTGLFIGTEQTGSYPWAGTIHRAIVKNGIAGTTVLDADFEAATPYVSAFTESALGAPVYVVSSTATSATANYSYVGPTGLVCSGVGTTAIAASADTADRYDTVGDIDVICKVAATDWTPANAKTIVGRSASSAQAWYLTLDVAGTLTLVWYTAAAAGVAAVSTVATGVTDGATKWVRATLDVDNGASGYDVKFYLSDDGTSWTQLGTTVTGVGTTDVRVSVNDLRVGSRYTGTDNTWSGTIMRAIFKHGIAGTTVFDADFVSAADYCATFTESSSNAATVTIDATNTPSMAAGALVSQINDLSGNARHLAQATAASMPKYWNGHNGYNVLVYDGTSDFIGPAAVFTLAQPFSHAVVLATADATVTNRHLLSNLVNVTPTTYQSGSNWRLYAGTELTSAATIDLRTHTLVNTFNGVSSTVRLDGAVSATGDGGSNSYGGTKVAQLSLTASPWKGTSGEVVIAVISAPANIEAYLKAKWGTP